MLVGIIYPYICKYKYIYIYISHPHALCGPLGFATLDGAACICRPKWKGCLDGGAKDVGHLN